MKELVVENFTPEKDVAEGQLKVESISSIGEFSRFKFCVHCNKKISQLTSSATVKCDQCNHVLKTASRREDSIIKALVDSENNLDEKFLYVAVFQEVVEETIGATVRSTSNAGKHC